MPLEKGVVCIRIIYKQGKNTGRSIKKCYAYNINTKELREYILETVSKNGGHLASNLGVIELTIALHSVFNTAI